MADRTMLSSEAQELSERVLEERYSQISEYVSAQTMLGDWDRNPSGMRGDPFDFRPTDLPTFDHPPSSHRERIKRALERLGRLDDNVELLLGEIHKWANQANWPSDRQIPLRRLQEQAQELQDEVRLVTLKAPEVEELRSLVVEKVEKALSHLTALEERWMQGISRHNTEAANASRGYVFYSTEHHFTSTLEGKHPVLQVLFFAILSLSVLAHLPRRWGMFLLQMIRYCIQLTMSLFTGISLHGDHLLASIPDDPRTILRDLHLNGRSMVYAVCPDPKCHALYAPKFSENSPIPEYPSRCSHKAVQGGRACSRILLRPKALGGTRIQVPIKTFVAFNFKDWLSNMVSRPLEQKLDGAWSTMRSLDPELLGDIFHGSTLRNFKGPDGNLFHVDGPEGRYVFSLCVDFFNPLGNRQAGKKKSIGIISLVCLNLPPDLRYKPENMFLFGIIPGPSEPPLDCLNHYLSPLVDEFLEFWDPGVFFSRTHERPAGRVVRCAIVAVVCDLPAARKTAGFAAVRHDSFCSICKCKKNQDGYVGKPFETWERRDPHQWRSQAEEYRDAADEQTRQLKFQADGVRWSELLRLPYFDPTRFVVVDAMHNLFLGLIQEHCKNILGIRFGPQPVRKVLSIALDKEWEGFEAKERKDVVYLKDVLEGMLEPGDLDTDGKDALVKRLGRRCHMSLSYMARTLGLAVTSTRSRPTKAQFATALVEWRLKQNHTSDAPPTALDMLPLSAGHVLSQADIEAIRSDIREMITPSWTPGIPEDLGSPRHGKLKADQWRLLGTVYLPASLIKRWGALTGNSPEDRFRRRLLSVTLSLLTAISIATSHNTSPARAALYLSNLQYYINGVRELFPDYQFRPNHHMAFHIHEFLLMYGPVHSWWCFPFERTIGMLQRIPTNYISGEYEETIGRAFTEGANLRGMLLKSNCPPVLRNCQPFFDRLFSSMANAEYTTPQQVVLGWDSEGQSDQDDVALLSESEPEIACWRKKRRRLPEDVLACMRQAPSDGATPSGVLSSSIDIRGHRFSVSSHHSGNSQAMVLDPSDASTSPKPSIIRRIFQLEKGNKITTYLLVDILTEDTEPSPFSEFPLSRIGVSLRVGSPHIVEAGSVQSHFARLDLDDRACLTISLSRS